MSVIFISSQINIGDKEIKAVSNQTLNVWLIGFINRQNIRNSLSYLYIECLTQRSAVCTLVK